MLISVIKKYLESHKRLVVPQLGAFIVKEPGCILFSELLKRDDGILRGLLRETGLGELEAAGEIDRFVFEIRHATEHGEVFPLDGFGTMKPGENGTIAFVYAPAGSAVTPGPSENDTVPKGEPEATGQGLPNSRSAADASAAKPSQSAAVRPVAAEPSKSGELHLSKSAKRNPEPYLKGLQYGKPVRTTDAYTYVDNVPRRRIDRFLVIAIIAGIIAVGAIAFGFYREKVEREAEAVELYEPVGGEIDDTTAPLPE